MPYFYNLIPFIDFEHSESSGESGDSDGKNEIPPYHESVDPVVTVDPIGRQVEQNILKCNHI